MLKKLDKMLEIKNISHTFQTGRGKLDVIKDISLSIQDKQFTSIVGTSGCGKTTLFKIISGLLKPTQGKIILDGKEITKPGEIGLVFQHYTLFPWQNVLQNVIFGIDDKKSVKEKEQIAKKYLGLVGLSGFEKNYPHELSGGMQQRVAIARALANNPKILLMDEPFGALDTQTRSLMQELLLNIWKKEKKTILFITHDIDEALFLSEKVYVMGTRPGRIKDLVNVNLKKRNFDLKFSDEFLNLKRHISYVIRGESIKAAQIGLQNPRENAIKISTLPWPGYAPFYLAEAKEMFEKEGVNVEILSTENDTDRISSFLEGRTDVIPLTLEMAWLCNQTKLNSHVILVINHSRGGDGLVVNKEIKNVKDLVGKKIAVEFDSPVHLFLVYLLNKHRTPLNKVQLVNMKCADSGAAFISGKVDAAMLWEPYLTHAAKSKHAKLLVTTKEEPKVLLDVLLVRKELIQKRRQDITKIINVWYKSVDYIKRNRTDSLTVMANKLGLTVSEFSEQINKVKFMNKNENIKMMNSKLLIEFFNNSRKLLSDYKNIKIKSSMSELLDKSFVRKGK
ncbi:ATP-binding cassette domain-containing protein [Candidatus Woesearchaeota archaeon]|nr:ATP-binding cassette domain-containing protein [Candidatus Woesearchaeota archaeon]